MAIQFLNYIKTANFHLVGNLYVQIKENVKVTKDHRTLWFPVEVGIAVIIWLTIVNCRQMVTYWVSGIIQHLFEVPLFKEVGRTSFTTIVFPLHLNQVFTIKTKYLMFRISPTIQISEITRIKIENGVLSPIKNTIKKTNIIVTELPISKNFLNFLISASLSFIG